MVRKTRKRQVKKQRGGQTAFAALFRGKRANGTLFSRNLTLKAPNIQYKGPGLYTLLMWDPDAPAASWLHWLVVNCEEGNIKRGEELVSYMPPTPPSGTHRYFLGLYSQKGPLQVEAPLERGYFRKDEFIKEYELVEIGNAMIQVRA
jgi:phosphatidylethanolamine-binding protein (PEBP) family uncharacterized protein